MAAGIKIAVIGAGLAGVRLAGMLSGRADVRVFEKSRGTGGRMSTRRAGAHSFDHGAQYFTAKGATFREFLTPFIDRGQVAEWQPRLLQFQAGRLSDAPAWTAPRFVGTPAMNSLCKAAAEELNVLHTVEVASVSAGESGWTLRMQDASEYSGFDMVLSTAPSVQTRRLMPGDFGQVHMPDAIQMQGCYTLMCGFETLPNLGWDAISADGAPLAWIAANHSKPGRARPPALICQTSNSWAEAHLEEDQRRVQEVLLRALSDVTQIDAARADHISLHRWRYAAVSCPAETPFLLDERLGLGAAGDWCGAGRVEAAFDSATALANRVLQHLS
ncbi:NAD(P)-binding protein [uncultured Roseobacter sp.]|uniref:NAD(P)/FAD-dependent oxidoreductase n=1 Tax=uncultured Roseobacter sp. TaxID=114847 RepID=UPI0026392B3F|nr:NAD(P)-binding protein [uncultured Roseobacter sp.]